MQLIGGGGREPTNLLAMLSLPCQGLKKSTKTETHAVMAERLARDLSIKEALLMEIKATIS